MSNKVIRDMTRDDLSYILKEILTSAMALGLREKDWAYFEGRVFEEHCLCIGIDLESAYRRYKSYRKEVEESKNATTS